jgi:TPR repeat protein
MAQRGIHQGYLLTLTADQGIAVAQFNYRLSLQNGDGVSMNLRRAAHYLKLCANQGFASAQQNYGLCLQNGKGVSID